MVAVRRLLIVLLVLVAGSPAATLAASLRNAELASVGEGGAQLVLTLSSQVDRRLFTLDAPDRVVIDLPGTSPRGSLRLPAPQGPVTNLRAGAQPGNTLRLVLVTRGSLAPRARWRQAGAAWQLVVDLGNVPDAGPGPAIAAETVPIRAAHSPADSGRDVVVAIDAGHGGEDPGAIGKHGTREKDVVLAIARALARRIDAEPGMKAFLTRDSDRFLVLRDRIDRARAARADIFISVHADSIANRSVAGSSVYVLSERGASSEAARWLAERENAADLKGGVSLAQHGSIASVLMDLSQAASIGASMEAAGRVLAQLDGVGSVRKTQVQQAGFLVLKSPDIPSMLVETAYISNPAEERNLRSPAHQRAVADAIFAGVRDHFRASPPDGSWFALQRSRGAAGPVVAGAP